MDSSCDIAELRTLLPGTCQDVWKTISEVSVEISTESPAYDTSHASEAEAKNIRTCRHRNILLAVDHKGHGRGLHEDVGGESPECFSVMLIHCREASVWLTVENQVSRSGEDT